MLPLSTTGGNRVPTYDALHSRLPRLGFGTPRVRIGGRRTRAPARAWRVRRGRPQATMMGRLSTRDPTMERMPPISCMSGHALSVCFAGTEDCTALLSVRDDLGLAPRTIPAGGSPRRGLEISSGVEESHGRPDVPSAADSQTSFPAPAPRAHESSPGGASGRGGRSRIPRSVGKEVQGGPEVVRG